MTFKSGFITGIVLGAFLAYSALGFGGPETNPETAKQIITSFGLLGIISTAYSVWKRRSFGNTTIAGLITGVGWSATGVAWLIFGMSYP